MTSSGWRYGVAGLAAILLSGATVALGLSAETGRWWSPGEGRSFPAQLDYARAMAFVAIDETTQEMLGGVRLHADANHEAAEYGVLLRSDLKGRGLGWKLMELAIEYARAEGLQRIEGQVLGENTAMLRMCRELGFSVEHEPDSGGIYRVERSLA